MASFYDRFRFEPTGRHLVEICAGTSCHARSSRTLQEKLEKRSASGSARPTRTGRFTLRTVRCLGLCALSPAMKIDGQALAGSTWTGFRKSWSNSHERNHYATLPISTGPRPPGWRTLYPKQLKILVGSASCGVAMGAADRRGGRPPRVEELGWTPSSAGPAASDSVSKEPLLDLVLPDGPRVSYPHMTPQRRGPCWKAYSKGDSAGVGLGPLHQRRDRFDGGSPSVPRQVPARCSRSRSGRSWTSIVARRRSSSATAARSTPGARRDHRPGHLSRCVAGDDPNDAEAVIERGDQFRPARPAAGRPFRPGMKWRLAREAPADVKYVVCNADEGEPGAYMDRTGPGGRSPRRPRRDADRLLCRSARREGLHLRPQRVSPGHRDPGTRHRRGREARPAGRRYPRHRLVVPRDGATWGGAYICGEETALIESLEGHSGEPRTRPPYPVTRGLWGKPTVVNNVKTWASVAPIITRGAAWYAGDGHAAHAGHDDLLAGGCRQERRAGGGPVRHHAPRPDLRDRRRVGGDRPLKAFQAGGASRGCLPPSVLDLAIDTEDRDGETILMGTGGVIVLDDGACMVDMARFLVGFFLEESCGKCVPCREGTKQMLRILTRICEGHGTMADLALLERLARTVKSAAVCGMGGMAPGAVLTTLSHFRGEFEAHIREKRCPAGVCRGPLASGGTTRRHG